MGIFGWSLPPGCTHRMIDDSFGMNEPCECCGKSIDDCICDECPECGEYGDPKCYKGYFKEDHGMEFSKEQLEGQKRLADEIEEDKLVNDAMYDEYLKDTDSILDDETSRGLTYDDPEIFKGD